MKNLDENDYFILYANCMPVKGAVRSIICDLQRQKFYYIPNALFDILKATKKKTLQSIFDEFEETDHEILIEYFDFLLHRDLGFLSTEPKSFPDMDLDWDMPSTITNSIIDVDEKLVFDIDYQGIFKELNQFNCSCVQIRSFKPLSTLTLAHLLDFTIDSRIGDIRLLLKFDVEIEQYLINSLIKKHKRISQVIFFNAPKSSTETSLGVPFFYLQGSDLNTDDCGQICIATFAINIPQYTEALTYNSCLNRKVSLDSEGNIKNCPSQRESFGNIKNVSLEEAIRNSKFQSLWKMKKDDIQVCKDCEYRYICTDCRMFLVNPNDQLSKPAKCAYDPYTATWG